MPSILTTDVFNKWFETLKDRRAKGRIQMRIDRMEDGNFGDWKAVGGGISELRIDYGPGYRVYFVQQGAELVILLAGGNKSRQDLDIQSAQQLARKL